MREVLTNFPTNNPESLKTFLDNNFSKAPQLLGGNHTNKAYLSLLEEVTDYDDDGNKIFSPKPSLTQMNEDLYERFQTRHVVYIVSPLPYKIVKSSSIIKQGLLILSRTLNDNAKMVKRSTLRDQLIKARVTVANFLIKYKDNTQKRYFSSKSQIWPQSHADLEKSVYSARGILNEVKEILSVEYQSCHSSIKLLVTCPEDIYQLLLQITEIQGKDPKTNQTVPLVNSTKSLGAYTLSFCTKERLLTDLKLVYDQLSSNLQKKQTKLAELTRQHVEYVTMNKMLNAIVHDLTSGEEKSVLFQQSIGNVCADGFYTEDNFTKVISFYY